ncbi:MAG: protein-L-isoaspartate O-methyltransferase [Magnetococcales bacterium]|nr:protein-L-isoaspartate O-methyltransferase [Magnetococcales bacterium]
MDFTLARTNMVKSQVVPNSIENPELISSLMKIEREIFVDEEFRSYAYSDYSIPLVGERRFLKPLQLSWMIQSLELNTGDKVLVIGAGTGYEAALLANMGMKVFALESDAALTKKGEALTTGIEWRTGDLSQGWADESPFDGIMICGAVPEIPNKAIGQLSKSGNLVTVVGNAGDVVMHAMRVVGLSGGDRAETLFETVAFPLPDFVDSSRFEL